MWIVGIAERGLLLRELGCGDYTEEKKGTQKGNHGGAKPENYHITKQRAEGHLTLHVYLGMFRNSVRSHQGNSG